MRAPPVDSIVGVVLVDGIDEDGVIIDIALVAGAGAGAMVPPAAVTRDATKDAKLEVQLPPPPGGAAAAALPPPLPIAPVPPLCMLLMPLPTAPPILAIDEEVAEYAVEGNISCTCSGCAMVDDE